MKADWKKRIIGKKLNQRGMTLVEVIVAMAILAIVVTPTLRIFASSAGTNFRAKQRQRATTVAEGVMERMKAYSVEQLCRQFQAGNFKGITSNPANPASMSVVGIDSMGTEVSALRTDMTLNTDLTAYKFKAQNASSEGIYYDIEALVTPKAAYSPNTVNMDSPSAYADAIIELEEKLNYDVQSELDKLARDTLELNFGTYHPGVTAHTVDKVTLTDCKRVITIDVTDDGTVQKVTVKVDYTCSAKVDYSYTGATGAKVNGSATYNNTVMKVQAVLPEGDLPDKKVWTVYDNSTTISGQYWNGSRQCKLNRIYLYLFPNYSQVFGTGAKDEIVVNGNLTALYDFTPGMTEGDSRATGHYPLELYVVKQRSKRISNTDVHLGEVGYSVSLTGNLTGAGEWRLVSNLDEYIGFQNPAPVTPSPSVSGFSTSEAVVEGIKDKRFLLYDVEIHVYNAGTTEEVAAFIGTMND